MPGNRQCLRSAKLLEAPLMTRGSTYKLNSQSEYDKGGLKNFLRHLKNFLKEWRTAWD